MKPFLVLALLTVVAQAATVSFAWDQTTTATRYDIYKINPLTDKGEWFGWSLKESFSGEFDPGTHRIAVIASNAAGGGPPSENLTFVVPESAAVPRSFTLSGNVLSVLTPATIYLTIQFSADLKVWKSAPSPEARFYRIKAQSQ